VTIKINELTAFLTVARTLSVQAAAQELRLTQPAVTKLVQRLEQQLGAQLFDRTSKPISLTDAGLKAVARAQGIVRDVARMEADFLSLSQPQQVRIGITYSMISLFSGVLVSEIKATFPNIQLHFTCDWTENLLLALGAGQLDFVIGVEQSAKSTEGLMEHTIVAEERIDVFASQSLADGGTQSLAELNELGWVLTPGRCDFRRALAEALKREGQELNVVAETYDTHLQLMFLAQGLAYGLYPTRMVRQLPAARMLKAIPDTGYHCVVNIALYHAPDLGELADIRDTILGYFSLQT
jgi:DNA-binding transcriptional LysR family regulator